MKQLVIPFLFLITTMFVLSACTPLKSTIQPSATQDTSLEAKSGYTEITGTLTQQANTFSLQTATETIPVESYSVELSDHVGTTLTVKGKYSGDTLFIEEILP